MNLAVWTLMNVALQGQLFVRACMGTALHCTKHTRKALSLALDVPCRTFEEVEKILLRCIKNS